MAVVRLSQLGHASSRRTWLVQQARAVALLCAAPLTQQRWAEIRRGPRPMASTDPRAQARWVEQATPLDPDPLQALVLTAVDAGKRAGASYVDARLTRIIFHFYGMTGDGTVDFDIEDVGLGVRALVNGYWGFAASPFWTTDEAARLGRDAVAQATDNAKGPRRTVELGTLPVATGTWATPIRIDPFLIPVEEKLDAIKYWKAAARDAGLIFYYAGLPSSMSFGRQERVIATSEGSLFTQTLYESGGTITVQYPTPRDPRNALAGVTGLGAGPTGDVRGLAMAGRGWELFLDAKIPEQMTQLKLELQEQGRGRGGAGERQATVGRYTLVCDGATMAALLERTLGAATQLDRALGYEANASGTSYLDDPLAKVGTFQAASPLVTVTANRSAPTQLATVKWDDEGVVPDDYALVKNGVLTDFQTTREQAGWLAPYYRRTGVPVKSHGCAAAQDAHGITMQMQPNLALAPSASAVGVDDLMADVKDGLLVKGGQIESIDFQAKNGLLTGKFQRISGGRLGAMLEGGAIMFNSLDLWKNVVAVGGAQTQAVIGRTQYTMDLDQTVAKGQPAQLTSYSTQGVAATILNQPLINPDRKAS